ncbi:Uma2 family endonuclease [Streptomyces bobili]|uniref:Uma2 family endonuclease n=1 Tax=Streptomyces bobili TaxID=67280 RepID=UPI0033BF81FA
MRSGRERQKAKPSDARREGDRYSFEDVLLISEVVSTSSARKDYDDCTAKYGRYGIPIYLVVDPYAQEVVLHTQPTAPGHIAAHTHKYGTGKLPIPLATAAPSPSPRRTPASGTRGGRPLTRDAPPARSVPPAPPSPDAVVPGRGRRPGWPGLSSTGTGQGACRSVP